jgi:hypothetical protein
LFEFDLQTNLRQIKTTSDVAHMLKQGGRMMHVSSLDTDCLKKRSIGWCEAKSWDEEMIRSIDPLLKTAHRPGRQMTRNADLRLIRVDAAATGETLKGGFAPAMGQPASKPYLRRRTGRRSRVQHCGSPCSLSAPG